MVHALIFYREKAPALSFFPLIDSHIQLPLYKQYHAPHTDRFIRDHRDTRGSVPRKTCRYSTVDIIRVDHQEQEKVGTIRRSVFEMMKRFEF